MKIDIGKTERFNKHLALQLEGEMERQGMNQNQLSLESGLLRNHIFKIMQGKVPIQMNTLLKVTSALNVKLCIDTRSTGKGKVITINLGDI